MDGYIFFSNTPKFDYKWVDGLLAIIIMFYIWLDSKTH